MLAVDQIYWTKRVVLSIGLEILEDKKGLGVN